MLEILPDILRRFVVALTRNSIPAGQQPGFFRKYQPEQGGPGNLSAFGEKLREKKQSEY